MFAFYLNNRWQYVTIGSTKSDDTLITHGVPQGSVLGPLLFLLYINDFSKCCNVFDFHIFADDTNLFYSNSNLAELESIVNYDLKMVSDWLMANKVSLNIDKTSSNQRLGECVRPKMESQVVAKKQGCWQTMQFNMPQMER